MYCPQCLTEYRDGFFECSDCRVALAPGLPPEPAEARPLELVTVLEPKDSFALTLAKAALEEAGIGYLVIGDAPAGLFGGGETPIAACACRVQVAPEDEAEARALLEPLAQPNELSSEI